MLANSSICQDYVKAFIWFGKAANQEYANAQNYLGIMYSSGQGVHQDYSVAKKWYNKACDNGHQKSCDNYRILNTQ